MDKFTLILAVVLPMIPAFLLFKFLPKSQAGVEGPFKGLQIKLGGAFAAYFIIFIALYYLYVEPDYSNKITSMENQILYLEASNKKLQKSLGDQCEIWTIKGKVLDNAGIPVKDEFTPEVVFVPEQNRVSNGKFESKFLVNTERVTYKNFPDIYLRANKYKTSQPLDLDFDANNFRIENEEFIIDTANNIVNLKTPVQLSKIIEANNNSLKSENNYLITEEPDNE